MLASSGTGIEVRSGKRGACFSIAKLPPTREGRRDERPTAGDQRGARDAPTTRRVPGEEESILIAATALPFAGEAETGI